MKKILNYFIIISVILIFSILLLFQIKAESYKNKVNNRYGFYINKERIRYTPFIFFYINSKVFEKHKIHWNKMNNIYYENKVFTKNKRNSKTYEIIYNIEYNAYLNYCFFNEKDQE